MDSQLARVKQHIQLGRVKQQDPKHERLRTRWTSSQDKIFADLVVQQIQQGNRSNDVFDQKAWEQIRDEFNAKTGLNFNKKQLRKHLDVLRMRYHSLKSAFEQNGSNLEQTNHFPDYELWGDLTEEKPLREPQKIKDCPIFNQLCVIFTESESDGRYAQSSHYKGLDDEIINADSPGPRSCIRVATSMLSATENVSSPAVGIDKNATNGRRRRQSETPCTPRPHLKNEDKLMGIIGEAMTEMIEASNLSAFANSCSEDDQFSITSCIKALDELQSIDQNLYFTSLDLFDNPGWREEFMSIESEKRLEWLVGKFENVYSSCIV